MDVAALLRYAVLAAAALAVLGAFGAMAVQARVVNPFGRLARAVRALTDPLLTPIERRILRSGGNPQSAPWWLAGIAVVGGIVLISAVEWAAGQAAEGVDGAGLHGHRAEGAEHQDRHGGEHHGAEGHGQVDHGAAGARTGAPVS